ncbi:MAG: hypothetical protein EBQ89_09385 [Alphaproteobacteria bacterium]|nr:hypothetical protein [Alphaproteobacteria bacterium]
MATKAELERALPRLKGFLASEYGLTVLDTQIYEVNAHWGDCMATLTIPADQYARLTQSPCLAANNLACDTGFRNVADKDLQQALCGAKITLRPYCPPPRPMTCPTPNNGVMGWPSRL